jgi:hypothetical protein
MYLQNALLCPVALYFLHLKGHGNEADFLGFLQKLVPHRSLTLPFESATLRLGDSPTWRVGESAFECLKKNLASRRVVDSPTRRVGESQFKFFKIIIDFPNFKRLNQLFKRSI